MSGSLGADWDFYLPRRFGLKGVIAQCMKEMVEESGVLWLATEAGVTRIERGT